MSVKPPTLPTKRKSTPPPVPGSAAPKAGRSILAAKIGALVLLAIVSVGIGAFGLPGKSKPVACPVVDPAADTPELESSPGSQGTLARHVDDDMDEQPTKSTASTRPVRVPSGFDKPKVTPQLPSRSGAYALSPVIDREINQALLSARVPSSPTSGDAEFIRRAYLDITGKIPPAEKVSLFLASNDPTKRSKLIDELLASSDYGVYFARLWAEMLVKRDFDNNRALPTGPFQNWLADRFNKNVGWDKIVTDIVTAEGEEGKSPQTFFVLANQDNKQPSPPKLVGAVGNLFMGIQIQCAECHKHPYINKWEVNDFWGMAAFFGHTKLQRAGGKGNKATGPATITEVEKSGPEKNKKGKAIGPAIKGGLVINIPDPNDPRKTIRSAKGKFFESTETITAAKAPYRPVLAKWLTAKSNKYFASAAVNRLWAHFFAKGIVHPIEEMGEQNPGTHPELLAALAKAFTESNFDLKEMIRAICNSEAYQRTSRPLPENSSDDKLFSRMPVKVFDARQTIDSLLIATGKTVRMTKEAAGKRGPRDSGDPLVRALDTKEYDDEATEFTYGIPQLLKMMNTGLTNASAEKAKQLATKHGGNQDKIVEEIYLATLARRPSDTEKQRIKGYLTKQRDPVQGYAGVFWALLNSAEFLSNH